MLFFYISITFRFIRTITHYIRHFQMLLYIPTSKPLSHHISYIHIHFTSTHPLYSSIYCLRSHILIRFQFHIRFMTDFYNPTPFNFTHFRTYCIPFYIFMSYNFVVFDIFLEPHPFHPIDLDLLLSYLCVIPV